MARQAHHLTSLGVSGHILMSGNCIHENVKTHLYLAHIASYRGFFEV